MRYVKGLFQLFQDQLNKIKNYKYNKYRPSASKSIGDLYNKNI